LTSQPFTGFGPRQDSESQFTVQPSCLAAQHTGSKAQQCRWANGLAGRQNVKEMNVKRQTDEPWATDRQLGAPGDVQNGFKQIHAADQGNHGRTTVLADVYT
jgi:hypothetical protein